MWEKEWLKKNGAGARDGLRGPGAAWRKREFFSCFMGTGSGGNGATELAGRFPLFYIFLKLFEAENEFARFRVAEALADGALDVGGIVAEAVEAVFFFLQFGFRVC